MLSPLSIAEWKNFLHLITLFPATTTPLLKLVVEWQRLSRFPQKWRWSTREHYFVLRKSGSCSRLRIRSSLLRPRPHDSRYFWNRFFFTRIDLPPYETSDSPPKPRLLSGSRFHHPNLGKRCGRLQTNVQISCGLGLIFRETNELVSTGVQGPVVQTLDSAVHWINNYRTAE